MCAECSLFISKSSLFRTVLTYKNQCSLSLTQQEAQLRLGRSWSYGIVWNSHRLSMMMMAIPDVEILVVHLSAVWLYLFARCGSSADKRWEVWGDRVGVGVKICKRVFLWGTYSDICTAWCIV